MAISISVTKGKGSINHNNREFITDNVHKELIVNNITYKKESLERAYEHLFGTAIAEYNEKQKRSDRRINGIKGYMSKIENSGNGEQLFYENIIQLGNMKNCAIDSENGKIATKILDEYMKSFEKRNPNLYVFNATLHLDESTPHLHIDYIPIAHNFKQGLSVRNSLDKALKEQGITGQYSKYENSTVWWFEKEKDYIATLMKEHNLERAANKGFKTKHKSLDQYKTIVKEIRNEVAELPKNIEFKNDLLNKNKVIVQRSDLESLEKRAKLSTLHEKSNRAMSKDIEKNVKSTSLELSKAKELRESYERLFIEQRDLNDKYNYLMDENSDLKAQIIDLTANFDKKVQLLVNEHKNELDELKNAYNEVVEFIQDILHDLKRVFPKIFDYVVDKFYCGFTQSLIERINDIDNSQREKSMLDFIKKQSVQSERDYMSDEELEELDENNSYDEYTL